MLDGDPSAPPSPPATPTIPAQRGPTSQPVDRIAPELVPAADLAAPAKPGARRALLIVGVLILAVVLAVLIGAMLRDPRTDPHGAIAAAGTPPATPSPPTPYEMMTSVLTDQAAALLRGEERGWLAAIDPGQPKLRARYQTMYRSLRALGVSQFEYHPGIQPPDQHGVATVNVDVHFCFSMDVCPQAVAPVIRQTLTLAPIRGRYAITRLANAPDRSWLQPTPWESGKLVFAQGKRVTVAAAPSQAKNLKLVVALADKAAAVTDRVAAFVGNQQQRYRIYLADLKSWRSWYGGENDKWTTGLEIPLNEAQSDVVLKMSALHDRGELARTLQHEMGHVATVGGATETGDYLYRENQWLSEGVAEYVEWSPRGAIASYRRGSVRVVLRGSNRPKSIVAKALSDNASDRTVDAFYGLGHFAVDCMAQTYGERQMYQFIRLRLREGKDLDLASRQAYGKPFATVDRTCVAWIRRHA